MASQSLNEIEVNSPLPSEGIITVNKNSNNVRIENATFYCKHCGNNFEEFELLVKHSNEKSMVNPLVSNVINVVNFMLMWINLNNITLIATVQILNTRINIVMHISNVHCVIKY
jgi:hypothetical protein